MAGAVPRRAAGPARRALARRSRGRRGAGAVLGGARRGRRRRRRSRRRTRPRSSPTPTTRATTCRAARPGVTCPARRRGGVSSRCGFDGPSHGNPFVDVELDAASRAASATLRVGGFYDGDGVYVIRLLADAEGEWRFVTALDRAGRSTASPARSTVAARGIRQRTARCASTASTSATPTAPATARSARPRTPGRTSPTSCRSRRSRRSPRRAFTKLRMCLFPKSYLYNANEPDRFPFPGSLDDGLRPRALRPRVLPRASSSASRDLGRARHRGRPDPVPRLRPVGLRRPRARGRRPVPAVRRAPARRVRERLVVAGERVRPAVGQDGRGLGALAAIVERGGPARAPALDPQLPPVLRLRPAVDHARERRSASTCTAPPRTPTSGASEWGKPVVIDECGYEGDIDQGWGNITGEELVRRFWEGAVRGGYVGHGETYLQRRARSCGGRRAASSCGASPARIGFLDGILAEAPDGVLDPLPSDWDVPWGGVAGQYLHRLLRVQPAAVPQRRAARGRLRAST